MADYYTDVAEARRVHALDEAIRNYDLSATTDEILARAREFEEYLKGGGEDAE